MEAMDACECVRHTKCLVAVYLAGHVEGPRQDDVVDVEVENFAQ